MAQGAYCSGCGRRVQLTEAGECPQGHLRSMLRDVREGVEVAPRPSATPTPTPQSGPAGAPGQSEREELVSAVIGKAFVIVPIAAVLAFGLWTGYEQGVGTGMSVAGAVLMSIGSLVVTVGVAFALAKKGRSKR